MAGVVYGSEVKDAMMSHRKRTTLESWGSRWNDEDVDRGNHTRQIFVPASITGRRDHECMNKNGNISKHGCEILNKGYIQGRRSRSLQVVCMSARGMLQQSLGSDKYFC